MRSALFDLPGSDRTMPPRARRGTHERHRMVA
jgi:hypothetical protein